MCRSLAAENHVGFRYEVGNNGDFATLRHAMSAGEGGQDCSVGAHTTERGRVQRLEPCFFFDNKLEPWLRGNMERKSTVEREIEREMKKIS